MDVTSRGSEVYFEIKRQFQTLCSSLSNCMRTEKCAILSLIENLRAIRKMLEPQHQEITSSLECLSLCMLMTYQ